MGIIAIVDCSRREKTENPNSQTPGNDNYKKKNCQRLENPWILLKLKLLEINKKKNYYIIYIGIYIYIYVYIYVEVLWKQKLRVAWKNRCKKHVKKSI